MVEVVVTRNGQITLTKEIREKLGIVEGDQIVINLIENSALISKKDALAAGRFFIFLPSTFFSGGFNGFK